MTRKYPFGIPMIFLISLTAACGDDDGEVAALDGGTGSGFDSGSDAGEPAMVYAFESRFAAGVDSVDRAGQTARQQLILRLKEEYKRISNVVLGGNSELIDTLCEGNDCSTGDLIISALLEDIYQGDSLTGVTVPYAVQDGDMLCDPSSDGALTHDDLSSSADIAGKFAGNDDSTDHKDWDGDMQDDDSGTNQPSEFEGFNGNPELVDENGLAVADISSPERLLRAFFSTFHHACAECLEEIANCPLAGTPLYTTPGGLDLQQLSEKLLHTGVSFSQASDDYLDDATTGKGLLLGNASERMKDGSAKKDTELAHVWDEGFGYFGGAIDYLDYSDDDIRGSGLDSSDYRFGYHDYNDNSCVDIASEINLGVAVNAAKRDVGSTTGTDFTTTLFTAFFDGRNLIHTTTTDLSSDQLATLGGYRGHHC